MAIDSKALETASRLLKLITKPVGKLRAWTFNDRNLGVKAFLAADPEIQVAAVLHTAQQLREIASRGLMITNAITLMCG